MINLIQRSLRPLLIIVFIIIAVSFTFFTAMPVADRNPQMDLGKIDGQKITADQFRDAESAVYTLLTLRYGNQIPESSEIRHQIQIETWQRMLLLASAKKMGLETTDTQIIEFIKNMPALQQNGVYQPERYQNLLRFLQQSMNINENRFTEIVREELTVEKMQKLITAPVQLPQTEVADQFDRIYGPVTLCTINFPIKNYLAQVTVTPAEIDSEYKAQIDSNPALRTKERRRVSFVSFAAPAPAAAAPGAKADPAKDEARRKIGEKALEFALALEPEPDATNTKRPQFADVAAKNSLTIAATGLFAAGEPAAPLPPSPNLNRAAFALSTEHPTSNVIETDNAFYVLKLEEIVPSQPRPLAEVRAQLEEQIKNRKAYVLMQEAGSTALEKLKAEIAKGTAFRAAAAQLKLTVETLPAFVPGDQKLSNDPKLALARRMAMQLKTGELSPFVPTAAGGVIGYLDSRATPDRKTYGDMETRLRDEMLSQARMTALTEWVRWRSTSKGTAMPAMLTKPQQG